MESSNVGIDAVMGSPLNFRLFGCCRRDRDTGEANGAPVGPGTVVEPVLAWVVTWSGSNRSVTNRSQQEKQNSVSHSMIIRAHRIVLCLSHKLR
jgi:hypothetical protein